MQQVNLSSNQKSMSPPAGWKALSFHRQFQRHSSLKYHRLFQYNRMVRSSMSFLTGNPARKIPDYFITWCNCRNRFPIAFDCEEHGETIPLTVATDYCTDFLPDFRIQQQVAMLPQGEIPGESDEILFEKIADALVTHHLYMYAKGR